jgi:hypothetical protein
MEIELMGLKIEAYVLHKNRTWETVPLDPIFDEELDDLALRQELMVEVCQFFPEDDVIDVGVYCYHIVDDAPTTSFGANC